jgi:plastocyanin
MIGRILQVVPIFAILSVIPAARGADHEIDQKNRAFSRSEITIKPGDRIVFKNSDDFSHNVFSMTDGMEFDIRSQAPGDSKPVQFDKEGVVEVRCAIHPKMRLVVTVKRK